MTFSAEQLQPDDADVIGNCRHCGYSLVSPQSLFCCSGCETVYSILDQQGLLDYYRLRDLSSSATKPVGDCNRDFEFLSSDTYFQQHVREEDGAFRTEWFLEGPHCAACVWLIEKVARSAPGVLDAESRLSDGRLKLLFNRETDLRGLAERLARLGYLAGLTSESGEREDRDLLRLGVSGALAANLMLMSLPFYVGLEGDSWLAALFAWLGFALALPLLLYAARPFFARARAGLAAGLIDFDLPIAVGLLSAFGLSCWQLVSGHFEHLYFDSMGMLVFFLLLGRYLQKRYVRAALTAGQRLLARMPHLSEVWREGEWRRMPAESIHPGDRLRLKAGDVLALDGVLDSAEAQLNLHVVSGEARPVQLFQGATLLAGSMNMGGTIEVCATSAFDASRYARFEQLARGFRDNRRSENGRLAKYFLLVVSLIAVAGCLYWLRFDAFFAFKVALTTFIIACPCALALAKPRAQALALRAASENGIWVQSLELFDNLLRIREVIFDKTGVLTEGRPRLMADVWFCERKHWLQAALHELELESRHPLSAAIREAYPLRLQPLQVEKVRVLVGQGVEGVVDGLPILIGSLAVDRAQMSMLEREQIAQFERSRALYPAETLVQVRVSGKLAALLSFRDAARPEARGLVQELASHGLKSRIFSGDQQAAVSACAQELGVQDARGGLAPEDKLTLIRQTEPLPAPACAIGSPQRLMVGDGLNDMGALAAAGVAVTHAKGSEAALKFADVILASPELDRIATLFRLVHASRQAARAGIAMSLAYNAIALGFTLAGVIGPLAAALLMPLSSISMLAITDWRFRHPGGSRWGS